MTRVAPGSRCVCTMTGMKGIGGLAGATVSPVDLLELTGQLASALGIRIEL